jgi:hypothetical protein
MSDDSLYSLHQIARMCGLSVLVLEAAIACGELKTTREGYFVRESALKAWLEGGWKAVAR